MPLGLFDHLQQTWLLFAKRWKIFVKISLIISLPFVVQTIVQNINPQAPWLSMAGLMILSVVVQIWGTLALIMAADNQSELTVNQAFTAGSKKIWLFFLTSLAVSLMTIAGFILLVIPGFYLMIALIFASLAAALETNTIKTSLHYSRQLVQGHWWLILWRLIVLIFLTMVVSGLLSKGLSLLLAGAHPAVLQSLLLLPIMLVIGPLTLLYNYILYKDFVRYKNSSHDHNL